MFVVILPIIQCGLFGVTVGRDPKDMRIAVVNDDVQCTYGGSLAGGLQGDSKGFPGYPSNCTTKTLRYLSCRMLALIDDDRIALVSIAATMWRDDVTFECFRELQRVRPAGALPQHPLCAGGGAEGESLGRAALPRQLLPLPGRPPRLGAVRVGQGAQPQRDQRLDGHVK